MQADCFDAARQGDLSEIQKNLIFKINVNSKNKDGSTALIYLRGKGADINIQNKDGRTALMYASGNGHIEVVKYLGEKVDINDKDGC